MCPAAVAKSCITILIIVLITSHQQEIYTELKFCTWLFKNTSHYDQKSYSIC
jgi:hypothetical protein